MGLDKRYPHFTRFTGNNKKYGWQFIVSKKKKGISPSDEMPLCCEKQECEVVLMTVNHRFFQFRDFVVFSSQVISYGKTEIEGNGGAFGCQDVAVKGNAVARHE